MAEKQISIDDLMRITKLPRYAVVKGVGLRAYAISLEDASSDWLAIATPYVKPVERAITEIYEGKTIIKLQEK